MTPTPASHDPADAESPAFLHAVAELARRRPVLTSRAVYSQGGEKLLEGGMTLDAGLVETLLSQPLAMRLDECLATDGAIDAVGLRKAATDAIRSLPFFAAMAADDTSREALLEAVAGVPLPAPVAFQLTLARETSFDQFDHGVLMALLCAYLVRETGGSAADMAAAAAAGLLHDLGMLHIDPALLQAGHRLSRDERRPLYVHPITSAMLVDRFEAYPPQVKRAIVEHHEQLDGSGYPRGLAGSAISPLGRVLSLAEVVTAMFDGKRHYPEQRVSLMLRISPRRFDAACVAAVQRLLAILPAPVAEPGPGVAESVQRLQLLAGLLAEWHDALDQTTPDLDDASRSVLRSFAEQAEALQSMLFDAGITAEQLGMLTSGAENDPALRIELWALAQELQWNLIASAHQLQRRWEGVDATHPIPEALAAWGDTVWALDTLD
ncbi:MAG: HD domain-containing phosphohydrolase [Burkholderiaceae bacterium]